MNDTKNEMTTEEIAVKILHLLSIYPIISPTMLQGALGGAMKPAIWKPVLDELVTAGKVIKEQESTMTPADRYNEYSKLKLPGTTVKIKVVADA